MIASPTNWKDVRKYFEGTFIVCPEYDPKSALYVDVVTDLGIKVNDGSTKGFIDFAETPYEILSPLSTRRVWFQTGNGAKFLQRIPARMWRKGINGENTHIKGFNSAGDITNLGGPLLDTVNAFLKRSYPTKFEVDGQLSIALNEKWAFHCKTETLFLFHCPIGKLSVKRSKISLLKEFGMLDLPESIKHMDVQYV